MHNTPVQQIQNLNMGMKVGDSFIHDTIVRFGEDECLRLMLATRDDTTPQLSKQMVFKTKLRDLERARKQEELIQKQSEQVEGWRKEQEDSVKRGLQITPEWLKAKLDKMHDDKEIIDKDYEWGKKGIIAIFDMLPVADYDDSDLPF